MTTFEQQILRALNGIGVGLDYFREEMAVSWLQRWASLIGLVLSVSIAVVGWMLIDRANRKSNRYAFNLQLRDAARNRILDALYDYKDFLVDVRSPSGVFLRNKSFMERVYTPGGNLLSDFLGARREIKGILRGLERFDRRRLECFKVIQRDAWTLNPKLELPKKIDELRTRDKKVTDSFLEYMNEAEDALGRSPDAGIRFVLAERGQPLPGKIDEQTAQPWMIEIDEQTVYVDKVIASLQTEVAVNYESSRK